MPAKDTIHDIVKTALIKDGWKITHEPFVIRVDDWRVFADLGAERIVTSQNTNRKIAVKIAEGAGSSQVARLENALGKFLLSSSLLAELDPARQMYLAFSEKSFAELFEKTDSRIVIQDVKLQAIIVDSTTERTARWIE